VSLLHRAGARPVRNGLLFFGACVGEPDFPLYAENLAIILEQAREVVVEGALLAAEAFDGALDAYRRWAERPDVAIWYARNRAEGIRP
jgi:hypothetical protein